MVTFAVPYHLDERLDGFDWPLEPDRTLTAELPEGDTWSRLAPIRAVVADAVAGAAGTPVTVMSGDCMVVLGTLAGLQRTGLDPAVVWFDAHGDVHTEESTASGYLGGMPLRIATGYRPGAADWMLRPVPEERAVLVGARDLDPPEAEFLATAGIGRRAVEDLTAGDLPDGPLLLHVDLDVVDPDVQPVRFPAAGGPDADAVLAAVGVVLGTGRVVAVDLGCTWGPGTPVAKALRSGLSALLGPGLDHGDRD